MSPFLTGLIDRAEGRAPVLARRPRALFEPVVRAFAPLLRTADEDMQAPRRSFESALAQAGNTEGEGPWPLSHLRRVSHVAHEAPAHTKRQSHGASRQDEGQEPPLVSMHPEPTPSTWRRRNGASEEGLAPVFDDLHEADHHGADRLVPTAVRSPLAAPGAAAAPVSHVDDRLKRSAVQEVTSELTSQAPSKVSAAATTATRTAVRTIRSREAGSDARTAMTAIRTPGHGTALSLAKAQALTGMRRATQPAAPAPVQISIGRVEIRAVSAPAERLRSTPEPAPRLSLDEYLRRRNGTRS